MQELTSILEAGVAAGQAPGFSAAVLTPEGARHLACVGARGADNPAPMTPDTLFVIASCSKAVSSVAALQLVERGLLDLDAPVGERLPALAAPRVLTGFDDAGNPLTRPAASPITLRHLLSHASGLAYDFTSETLASYVKATGASQAGGADPDYPLLFDPGEGWQYGVGIDWTGRLIEAVTGAGLDAFVGEHILRPLGMDDTTYFPDAAQTARRAGVCQSLPGGEFLPVPFAMPPVNHFMMGGAGLYSTAGDYLTFLAAIASGGAPLLKPETFALMMTPQFGDRDAGAIRTAQPMMSRDYAPLAGLRPRHGLAGLINLDPVPGGRAAGSLAWAGLTNCYYWADPRSGVAGVLLAQVLPFADPAILATFEAMERAVYA
jgi:CubicO group peptidase (beta-lactamase class C family)